MLNSGCGENSEDLNYTAMETWNLANNRRAEIINCNLNSEQVPQVFRAQVVVQLVEALR